LHCLFQDILLQNNKSLINLLLEVHILEEALIGGEFL